MENYKVCILAAGVGSRMFNFTKHFNKVLIPVKGKPIICHIIEKFPEDIEIVIAVGYMKDSVINFLTTAYPNRKITFVHVDPFQGKGSGPGFSLLSCKSYLQCPFIQFAGDTLVKEEIPFPNENWYGVAEINSNIERFQSVKIENNKIVRIDDKIKTDNKYAFIGLAGVKDYEHFWKALEGNKELIANEIQVSNGFKSLIEKGMSVKIFTWFDTGTPNAYAYALENYPNGLSYQGQ